MTNFFMYALVEKGLDMVLMATRRQVCFTMLFMQRVCKNRSCRLHEVSQRYNRSAALPQNNTGFEIAE
jgi:hypothetical protein